MSRSHRALAVVTLGVVFITIGQTASAQPFFLSRTLVPAEVEDLGVGDGFVASGSTLVIGVTGRRVAGQFRAGGVDVVDPRSGARLRTTPNPTPLSNEAFGIQVALAGGVVITGAPFDTGGKAYFLDAATGAVLQTIPRPGGAGYFGGAVTAYGTRAVIGSDGGPVRVYDADPSSLTFGGLLLTLANPSGGTEGGFGRVVGTVGGNVLVGAPFSANGYAGGVRAGVVYMFDGTTGTLLRTFRTPEPEFNDFFGAEVLGVGNTVVVSGLFDDSLGADTGDVYLFDSATGALLHTFENPTPGPGDSFGSALALVGSHLLIGASDDDAAGQDLGAVHVFDFATGTLEQTILSPGVETFGSTVAAVGSGFVVSGFGSDEAYLFSDDVCGNGTVGPFEECDDGDLDSGDGCDANCTNTRCGNRILTAGEQCDDGDTAAGDCCAADCQFEAPGSVCPDDGRLCYSDLCDGAGTCAPQPLPAGTDCESDGNVCTQDTCNSFGSCVRAAGPAGTPCASDGNACTQDACDASAFCRHTLTTCDACLACDPGLGCIADVATFCQPALPGRSDLVLRTRSPDTLDALSWTWTASALTPAASFGDPTATTDYEVCVFDQTATSPRLVAGAGVPAGGICPGQLCWRPNDDGVTYYDRGLANDGILRIRLRGGAAGAGRITVKGRGPNLALPAALSVATPLRVQLRRPDTGACWDATFSTTARNRSDLVKARAD